MTKTEVVILDDVRLDKGPARVFEYTRKNYVTDTVKESHLFWDRSQAEEYAFVRHGVPPQTFQMNITDVWRTDWLGEERRIERRFIVHTITDLKGDVGAGSG